MELLTPTRKIIADQTIVLLIDMQKGFLDNISEQMREPLINTQRMVINYCAARDVPLVVLEYTPRCFGRTNGKLSRVAKMVPRNTVVEKKSQSGFNDTNLEEVLQTFERQNLYLMGIYTDQCVQKTAEDALKKNFKIAISQDVTSCEGKGEITNLDWFKGSGVYTDTYIEMIEIMESPVLHYNPFHICKR